MTTVKISGRVVDVVKREIYPADVFVSDGVIADIVPVAAAGAGYDRYIMPGFVDSHCHIESSMLVPSEFARNAVRHGTVATVSDPHEIANVCGWTGIDFMLDDAARSVIKIFFTLPSCVPSVPFDKSGAEIDAAATAALMSRGCFVGLSEMMNSVGVVNDDAEVYAKLKVARKAGVPVDGHAPGLRGEPLRKYVGAGISTDHECTSIDEAEEKIRCGMKIQIREGSSAKSFDELLPLVKRYPDRVMFCTDDYKAFDLKQGHINRLVARAVAAGVPLFDALGAATLNPIEHYSLPVGVLRKGDSADFIITENLTDFVPTAVYIDGRLITETEFSPVAAEVNNFSARPITESDIPAANASHIIGVHPDTLFTDHLTCGTGVGDVAKIVCYNRYRSDSLPVSAYVRGFGLKRGAFGSTVGHDSHNITVVGCDDASIVKVVNAIIEMKGGAAFFDGERVYAMPLAIAGLMANASIETVIGAYSAVSDKIRHNGCTLPSPFMTLSFMSLPVIPALKIPASGLFDVERFEFVK